MRERLRQYIERLFVNAPGTQSAKELKEEMLQNLLDKYDDLIREGKSEEDAYTAAIAGIGDVDGLFDGLVPQAAEAPRQSAKTAQPEPKQKSAAVLAIAIAMYVLSVIPNFFFANVFGVVLMFSLIAAATGMLIINRTVVHPTRAALVGVGVAVLIMSPASVILIPGVLGVTLLFVMLGAGVGLIVYGRTSQFDTAPVEPEDAAVTGSSKLARSTKIGYAVLAAFLLVCLLVTALSGSVRPQPATVLGLTGEVISGPEGAAEIVVGEDFEQRIEDAIDERIDDNLGDNIESAVKDSFAPSSKDHDDNDHDDDHDDDYDDDHDDNKKNAKKAEKNAAATTAIMEGAAEVQAAGITEIDVDWVGGEVEVSTYGGDTIAISETASKTLTERQKLRYTVKGNKLSISYCEDTSHVWDWLDIDRLSMPEKTLTLQLPVSALPELEINSVSAKVNVSGVAVDELDVESISGKVTVTDISGRKLSVQTTNGEAIVRGADVTKLDLESTSGSLDVTGSRADEVEVETISASAGLGLVAAPRKLEVEAISGDTTLTLPKDATDFAVEVETVSGDFSCAFAAVQQRGLYVVGSGAYRYAFTSVNGDFSITAG